MAPSPIGGLFNPTLKKVSSRSGPAAKWRSAAAGSQLRSGCAQTQTESAGAQPSGTSSQRRTTQLARRRRLTSLIGPDSFARRKYDILAGSGPGCWGSKPGTFKPAFRCQLSISPESVVTRGSLSAVLTRNPLSGSSSAGGEQWMIMNQQERHQDKRQRVNRKSPRQLFSGGRARRP